MVVGTPGRVIDLVDKKRLKLSAVRFFILDEVRTPLSNYLSM